MPRIEWGMDREAGEMKRKKWKDITCTCGRQPFIVGDGWRQLDNASEWSVWWLLWSVNWSACWNYDKVWHKPKRCWGQWRLGCRRMEDASMRTVQTGDAEGDDMCSEREQEDINCSTRWEGDVDVFVSWMFVDVDTKENGRNADHLCPNSEALEDLITTVRLH